MKASMAGTVLPPYTDGNWSGIPVGPTHPCCVKCASMSDCLGKKCMKALLAKATFYPGAAEDIRIWNRTCTNVQMPWMSDVTSYKHKLYKKRPRGKRDFKRKVAENEQLAKDSKQC